ncbi:acyl-CoA thioester hydrolase/BAAT C-terminal domain-containing protein [Actinomadura opuntiae]|uniref:acyl-CoA thioester hydrolase/BAAT C-terminal domain-containing protein n=1 Tax=Actinomadura sp. OS1-43 TaxID=604315 RepID=UPI00333ED0E5
MGDGPVAEARLARDLDVAVRHLRAVPGVDGGRIGLLGHSMGAAAVVRYAEAHPDVRATVAISQGTMLVGAASRPRNLLLVAGGLEFADYRDGAVGALRAAYPQGHTVRTVGGVADRRAAGLAGRAGGGAARGAGAGVADRRVSGRGVRRRARGRRGRPTARRRGRIRGRRGWRGTRRCRG